MQFQLIYRLAFRPDGRHIPLRTKNGGQADQLFKKTAWLTQSEGSVQAFALGHCILFATALQ